MRFFILLTVLLLILPLTARAQTMPPAIPGAPAAPVLTAPANDPAAVKTSVNGAEGEVVDKPICFNVINKAPYTVLGNFATNEYMTPEGIPARHRGNFRLGVGEQTNFCTLGPFYAGRKIDLTLRSLIPLFSCRTGVGGDIVIYGREKPEGGTDTWADCLK